MNMKHPEPRVETDRTGDLKQRLKIISLLLGFPDAELVEHLPQLEDAADRLFPAEAARQCRALIAHLQNTPLIRLQENYTAIFDVNPAACLNLTYHRWGDGEDRGKALADIQEVYYRSGYGRAMGELPDYLPMVLEFLSACEEIAPRSVFADYAEAVGAIAGVLRKAGSPYAGLIEILMPDFATLMEAGNEPILPKGAFAT